jgi:hypothetical protein
MHDNVVTCWPCSALLLTIILLFVNEHTAERANLQHIGLIFQHSEMHPEKMEAVQAGPDAVTDQRSQVSIRLALFSNGEAPMVCHAAHKSC